MLHKTVATNTDDIHAVANWTVANAAALAALSLVAGDIGKVAWQQDTDSFKVLKNNVGPVWVTLNSSIPVQKFSNEVALSDLSTNLTVGNGKASFFAECDLINISFFVGVATQQAAGAILMFDVNKNGTSMMTTTKLTIDNGEDTSLTAATPAVLTTTTWSKGDKITVDIDVVGTALAKGAVLSYSGDRP